MLDPVVCVNMTLGEPRVTVDALRELHRLLVERGLRGHSSNDSTFVQEECDEFEVRDHSTATSAAGSSAPSDQPGLYFSSTVRHEPLAEGASPELSGQPSDAGRRRRKPRGQR